MSKVEKDPQKRNAGWYFDATDAFAAAGGGSLLLGGTSNIRSGIRIGSFNIKNYSVKGSDAEYGKARLKAISKLISREGFAVVALQEIKNSESLKAICEDLNGTYCERTERIVCHGANPGCKYCWAHCSTFYDELFKTRQYGSKTGSESQAAGELGYIWKKDVVHVAVDEYALVVYRGIKDRMTLMYDGFIAALAVMTMEMVRISNRIFRKNKKPDKKECVEDLTLAGLAGVGCVVNHTTKSEWDEESQDKAEGILRQTIRPPFVILLNFNHDRNKQLRLINVHSQFGLAKVDEDSRYEGETQSACQKRIRQEEARFVANTIFDIVESQRSGGFETAITMALGDFNLEFSDREGKSESVGERQLADEVLKLPMPDVLSRNAGRFSRCVDAMGETLGIVPSDMTVAQQEKSTLSLKAAKDTSAGEKVCCPRVSSYDHFLFKSDVWQKDDAEVLQMQGDDDFFVKKNVSGKEILYPISDHLPVVIESSKI